MADISLRKSYARQAGKSKAVLSTLNVHPDAKRPVCFARIKFQIPFVIFLLKAFQIKVDLHHDSMLKSPFERHIFGNSLYQIHERQLKNFNEDQLTGFIIK